MNSRELVFSVLGMVTVLVFVEKDSQFFPVFCCFGNESILWLHVETCATGSQNSGMLVASGILGNSLVSYLYC